MYQFNEFINREGTGSVKWEIRAAAVKKAGTVPLSVADMEFRCPPEVTTAVQRAAQHGIYGYTLADDAYFEALRGFMKRRHGSEIERDWLLVTNGVVSALGMCVRALSEPGDAVVIQPPVYAPFLESITANGRKPYFNQLVLKDGRYEINFNEFETFCAKEETKLFILSSPHNPVGRIWTTEELQRLAQICAAHGVKIIADEIHADIILEGYHHTSMLNIPAAKENCAVCTAVSKTFNLAGLSCSDIFVPNAEMRKKLARQQAQDHAFGMNYFARAASIAAHTQCDAWLDELNAYLTKNFQLMYDFIGQRLPVLDCIRAEGTYLAWVDMRALGLSDCELKDFCENKANLALTMGDWFGMGGSGFTRWNVALPMQILSDSLDRFAAAVDKLTKGWCG